MVEGRCACRVGSNCAWTQAAFRAVASSRFCKVTSAESTGTSATTTVTCKSPKDKVSPDAAREAARNKILKLERALEVLSDSSGPSVDALKSELEKARQAAKARPLKVQITSTQDFIRRSERHVAELEAERIAEAKLLEEARELLRYLEAARSAEESRQPPRWIWAPKCRVCSKRSANCRKSGMRWRRKSRVALWRDPECVNGCRRRTSQKMSSHQCPRWSHESSQRHARGDVVRELEEKLLELTSLQGQAADKLAEMTGGMVY